MVEVVLVDLWIDWQKVQVEELEHQEEQIVQEQQVEEGHRQVDLQHQVEVAGRTFSPYLYSFDPYQQLEVVEQSQPQVLVLLEVVGRILHQVVELLEEVEQILQRNHCLVEVEV